MEWTQKKNADTINKFSTEKERKKRHENNLSNKFIVNRLSCSCLHLPPNVTCLDFTLSNGFCQMKIKKSSPLRPPMHLINSPHLCYTRSNTEKWRLLWKISL